MKPRDTLVPESRINYAKIYTVEHNVKVAFIGDIAPASQHIFVTDHDMVWAKRATSNRSPNDNVKTTAAKLVEPST